MKRSLFLSGFCAAVLVLQGQAKADYFTNFDGDPFANGYNISYWVAQGNGTYSDGTNIVSTPDDWTTNDQNQLDSTFVAGGYSQPGGDLWGRIGGADGLSMPSTRHIELWTPLTENNVKFTIDFAVTSSASPLTGDNDSFGWTFRNTTGDLLFKVMFEPDSANPSSTLDVVWYDSNDTKTVTNINIGRNSLYGLAVTTDLANGSFLASITDSFNTTISFDGTTTGEGGIGQIAATWDVTANDLADAGNNMMLFNDYDVTSIPEPSTGLLLLSGMGALAMWRRNRKNA